MDMATGYPATLLEMAAHGIPRANCRLHPARGEHLGGAWRDALGDRAADYRYEACCAQVGLSEVLGKEPRPFPWTQIAGADGVPVALQLWDQRVWWDNSGIYLEARWRPDTGEQPYSLHGLGPAGRLPHEQRVRGAIALLGTIQGGTPSRESIEEAAGSPYWADIGPIMDRKRRGQTIDQIAIYLSMNPSTVRKYVGIYDRLHPEERA